MHCIENGSHRRACILLALAIGGVSCSIAGAAVELLGTQYQQDNPYLEYMCWYHYGNYPTSCGVELTGSNAHVFLKNTGGSSVTINDVTLAGYNLDTILRRNASLQDSNSIYYYWDNPPQDVLDAGEPVWYRADPNPIPAGGVAQVIVRLRWAPVTTPISIGVVTSAGTVNASIPVNASDPVLASVSFSEDRTKVCLHWRRSGGAAPTSILMDGVDVTASTTTVGDASTNFAASLINLATPLTNMSYHVYRGVYADGKTATGALRTWYNRFLYGTWGAHAIPDNDSEAARAWINTCNNRGVNCVVMNSTGGLQDYLATAEGKNYAEAHDYGYVKDSNVWGNNPRMWMIEDEPDVEEGGIPCGTGMRIPCGGGHVSGIRGMYMLELGEALRAVNPSAPTTINLDGGYKPHGWYAYGQLADVMMVDAYYEQEMAGNHWYHPERDPLYTKPTSIYATAIATTTAAEPNPMHMILYSCEYKDTSIGEIWPFSTPASKRIQAYYALAGGAKGMAYWWFKAGYPFNGLDDGGPEAQALWKEIGLIGNEIKTAQPLLVTGHPVTMTTSASSGVWVKTLAAGIDSMILIAVNDQFYNDEYGTHYTPVSNANVTVTLPSWLQSSPTAFAIGPDGTSNVSTSLNGNQLQVALGTLNVTRMIVITTNPQLKTTIQARYDEGVSSGVCAIAPEYCSTTPTITQQPASIGVVLGETASFNIVASGGGLSYQWKKDGANLSNGGRISGATTATLQITNVEVGDNGGYSCDVSNSHGQATSSVATLTTILTDECIQNADAEGGFTLYGSSYIAAHWTPWESASGINTGYDETVVVHGGAHSQRIRVWKTGGGSGGTYQRIPATAGSPYTVSVWTQAYDTASYCYLGVDPTGGTDPTSTNISWSPANNTVAWVQKSVSVTATSDQITVFYKVVSNDNNKRNGYFDDATPVCEAANPTAPTITQHPSAQNVNPGSTVYFSVSATGQGTLTYQWQKNQSNLSNGGHYSGCTTATLTISSADGNDVANYRCVVTNSYGNATSNEASLTVTTCTPGTLLNGDFEGGNTNGVATGWTGYQREPYPTTVWTIQTASPPTGGGLQYQQIANTSAAGGGGVRQNVTDCTIGFTYTIAGWMRTNSASATCTVKCSPTASTNWATAANLSPAQTTTSNAWVPFSGEVTATGTAMTIWLDGQTGGSGLNKASCFDSITVSGCTVSAAPTIIQHPAAQSVCSGGTANFSVSATGDAPLSYLWQKNSANLSNGGHYSGVNTTTLTVSGADASDVANYRCVVSNGSGSATSNAAALTLKAATTLTQQPQSRSVSTGGTATFTVAATGDGALTYQWQKNSVNLVNGGHYSGATTATLTVSNADGNDVANYRCVVTGGCGSATSNPAALTLGADPVPGDFDSDGDVDLTDFAHLQNCLDVLGAPPTDPNCADADLDNDAFGAVSREDVTVFLQCMTGAGIPGDPNCAD